MTTFPWKVVLTAWSRAVLQWDEFVEDFKTGEALYYAKEHPDLRPPDEIPPDWLGYLSTTEAQIAEAEARLGTTFPPSYRQFLAVSNGWRGLVSQVDHLYSTDEVDWLRVREQRAIDIALEYNINECTDEEYFVYDENDEERGASRRCPIGRTEHCYALPCSPSRRSAPGT